MQLSTEDYGKLCRLIYDRLGLAFDDKKIHFLSKRVADRMQLLQLDDPSRYLFLLTYGDAEGTEMQALANLVTINETYMFREYEQLQAFANCCLPEVISRKQALGERRLRIWSAGCSSGEEPYTLAIILREVFPDSDRWDVEITATDIDQQRLAMARSALYGERSVKHVPQEYLARHFREEGLAYRVLPDTARLVRVINMNLSERAAMRMMFGYDFVFCRNVLIYFDDRSRKAAVDHFYNALNPGGFIFLGHSESVGRISTAFRLRRFEEHLVYMKPEETKQ